MGFDVVACGEQIKHSIRSELDEDVTIEKHLFCSLLGNVINKHK